MDTIAIGVNDVRSYREDLLRKAHLEMLVTGNTTEDVRPSMTHHTQTPLTTHTQRSINLISLAEQCLISHALTYKERPINRSLLLPSGAYDQVVLIMSRPLIHSSSRIELHSAHEVKESK